VAEMGNNACDLYQVADELGVTVLRAQLPAGWWGSYERKTHTITIHPLATGIQFRSAFAHELGHAYYRHRGSTPRSERQASDWASNFLIERAAFIECLAFCESIQAIAHALGVLPSDVENYIRNLTPSDRACMAEVVEGIVA
jgi:hypothetical protein